MACLFAFAPFVFKPGATPDEGVRLGSSKLPTVCVSKRVFGVSCPGCGLTRAFVLIAHGRFVESLAVHRAGLAIYGFVLWQVVARAIGVWKPLRPVVGFEAAVQRFFPVVAIVLLVGNWLLGLAGL